MAAQAPQAPLSVYMLADHLDAALAAGEDLLARGADLRQLVDAPGNMQTFPERQRALVEEVRAFELVIIARILKARDHARALATADARFAAVANLFVSGTAVLMDAVEECGDATADDFETGDALIAYLRGRGLITTAAASVAGGDLICDDSFLVVKRASLGALMDMAAAFLDALEAHYDLFSMDEESDEQAETGEARSAPPREQVKAASHTQAASPVSTRAMPRKEFGQRHRSELN